MIDKSIEEMTINERIGLFEQDFTSLLDRYKLAWLISPEFPIYNVLPAEISLALEVIKKNGVQYKISYADKK